MLEPKSHSLTSERFLINQGSILTHKNGIFIDWVWQPLWRDLRDYWVNMWYKSACLRRFFFFWFPHLMCSRWMNWRQRSTGTKLFSVQFSKPQTQALTNLFGKHPWISSLCTELTLQLCWDPPFLSLQEVILPWCLCVFFVPLGTNDEAHHFCDEIISCLLNFP